MSFLINEILLRLVKPILATVIGFVVYYLAVTQGGLAQGTETLLLCWLIGAAAILLVQEGPL